MARRGLIPGPLSSIIGMDGSNPIGTKIETDKSTREDPANVSGNDAYS